MPEVDISHTFCAKYVQIKINKTPPTHSGSVTDGIYMKPGLLFFFFNLDNLCILFESLIHLHLSNDLRLPFCHLFSISSISLVFYFFNSYHL